MSRSHAPLDADEPGANGAADADAAVLAERLRERAVAVAADERREAEVKLENQGGLTDAQRETLAALADALTADILGPSMGALTADEVDDETRRTIAGLFDIDAARAGNEACPRSTADD